MFIFFYFLALSLCFGAESESFWRAFGEPLESLWRALERLWRDLWRDFGETLERLWRDFGETLERLWRDFGETERTCGVVAEWLLLGSRSTLFFFAIADWSYVGTLLPICKERRPSPSNLRKKLTETKKCQKQTPEIGHHWRSACTTS